MNVLSLFDGISCGHQALKELGLGDKIGTYFASEVDAKAIGTAIHNHDCIQLGDVRNISYKNGVLTNGKDSYKVKIDLILAGSPCFVAGTPTLSEHGNISIEDVKKGDMVFTHKQRLQRVVRTGGKKAKVYEIKAMSILPLKTTFEHPFYVRQITKKFTRRAGKTEYTFNDFSWKNAGNLAIGDYLTIPRNLSCNIPPEISVLTDEDLFVLGRYVSDGHTRKDYRTGEGRPKDRHWQLVLSVGSHKIPEIEQHNSLYLHTKATHRMVFSKKQLVLIAEKYIGCGAINKVIHPCFLSLPKERLKIFLNGLISGDGSYNLKKDLNKVTTISRDLAESLVLCVAKVYGVASTIYETKRPAKTIIEGRVVNQKDTFTVEWRSERKKQSSFFVDDEFIYVPFREMKCVGEEMVYNIEVENDNSYIVQGVCVHNCQGFSFAGKRLAFDDHRSKLYFEFERLLKEIKPKHFFLENVRMHKEHCDVISERLNTIPIILNASQFSAQNRLRYYWTNIPQKPYVINDKPLSDIVGAYDGIWVIPRGTNRGGLKPYRGKCPTITTSSWQYNFFYVVNGVRQTFTPEQCEEIAGLPVGYTQGSLNNRIRQVGNGWSVPTVKELLKGLKQVW